MARISLIVILDEVIICTLFLRFGVDRSFECARRLFYGLMLCFYPNPICGVLFLKWQHAIIRNVKLQFASLRLYLKPRMVE